MSASDRRRFFKELLRGAVQTAEELGSALRSESEQLFATSAYEPIVHDAEGLRQETVPAAAAARCASLEELRALCAEVGLERWTDETVAAARASVRLTPGEGRSRLGGLPEAPPRFEWPVWRGEQLTLLAQIRLDELPESPLPRSGSLLLFYALASTATGLQPSEGDACRVLLVDDEGAAPVERPGALPAAPVVPSAELTLPLEPPLPAPEPVDVAAWIRLRERLAELQGVELAERAGLYVALHRLLGHPDALAQGMELDAQLVSHGIDLNTGERYFHPRLGELEPGAADWRLLLQLSSDDAIGVLLGWYARLYVWIRDEDLRAGDFSGVRAFVR